MHAHAYMRVYACFSLARLNGSILNAAAFINNVVASAAESELGACF
jgi:hypothetical protein